MLRLSSTASTTSCLRAISAGGATVTTSAFYVLIHAQGFIALAVALYGVRCFVLDLDDIVTRYILRAGTAAYMWLFFCACLVGLAGA